MEESVGEVLTVAMEAGKVMLENGAETFRVEDTMKRIASHYGVRESDFFVLTNGIFTSGTETNGNSFARVKYIPVNSPNLSKVVAINQLSREIARDKYTLKEAREEIERIKRMNAKTTLERLSATSLSAACFALLFSGTLKDGLVALIAGLFLGLFIEFISKPHLSKITSNLIGSALVTSICLIFHHYGLSDNMNAMIAGSIIPLIPGIPFVNGIRDIGNGDYLSGMVRLLDAIFVFICIAVGVGVILALYSRIQGGLFL